MKALDTNTIIHFFKGVGRVREHLLALPPAEIAIPCIVLYELEVGLFQSTRPSTRRAQLGSLAAAVSILPFDEPAARSAAEIRSVLARTGNMIGPLDILIAGTALAHNAVLVTHNTREFERVPGLKIVDWH